MKENFCFCFHFRSMWTLNVCFCVKCEECVLWQQVFVFTLHFCIFKNGMAKIKVFMFEKNILHEYTTCKAPSNFGNDSSKYCQPKADFKWSSSLLLKIVTIHTVHLFSILSMVTVMQFFSFEVSSNLSNMSKAKVTASTTSHNLPLVIDDK